MQRNLIHTTILSLTMAILLALPAFAQDVGISGTVKNEAVEKVFPKHVYSPYAGRNYLTRPYFGDTHLYTGFSMNAG